MHFNFKELVDKEKKFQKVTYEIKEDFCILKWEWPVNVDIACIYWSESTIIDSYEKVSEENFRIVTKNEFFSIYNGELKVALPEMWPICFIILPGIIKKSNLILFKQNDKENSVLLKFGVFYSIIDKGVIRRNKKIIDIIVETDFYLKKDSLRYVVKRKKSPKKLEDGIAFPFNRSFIKGINRFEDIRISIDEYTDVFFKEENDNDNFILKRKR